MNSSVPDGTKADSSSKPIRELTSEEFGLLLAQAVIQAQNQPPSNPGGLSFVVILLIVVFAFVLVDLWSNFADNLALNQFGINPNSTLDTFVVALVFTVIILFAIYVSGQSPAILNAV